MYPLSCSRSLHSGGTMVDTARVVLSVSLVSAFLHFISRSQDVIEQITRSSDTVDSRPLTGFLKMNSVVRSVAGAESGPQRALITPPQQSPAYSPSHPGGVTVAITTVMQPRAARPRPRSYWPTPAAPATPAAALSATDTKPRAASR